MKRLFTITMLLCMVLIAWAKPVFPTISTQGKKVFYYIQMQNGKGVITAFKDNEKVHTATPSIRQQKKQIWKVIKFGNGYSFINAAGQTLYYSTSQKYFYASNQPSGIKKTKDRKHIKQQVSRF